MKVKGNAPEWLKDAVFYEIYPQSFYDSNGDGIGDIPGIIRKLDYIKELGCNAVWLNPCFDSPFKDAGYDVRDYKKVAERYGTNEDLYALFEKAHEKGIRIVLDLVPGHTSEEHAWFKKSCEAEENEYSDRYVWTDFWLKGTPGYPYIGGETPRNGTYMLNFFKCQPALNYGWLHPDQKWQKSMDDPAALATRQAMKDIMCFWLDHGCDGFRVDMASSLVKGDDEKKTGTSMIWREVRQMLDEKYPEAVLISEWGDPALAVSAGFHMDFYLDHTGNGYNSLLRDWEGGGEDHSYFKKDSGGDIRRFLKEYVPLYEAAQGKGCISLITCNHDTPRATATLSVEELKLAYAFLFTMPGVPFLYYGDEIGMRYLKLPSKEGGYTRTGTRTPMQWSSEKNMGFSDAPAGQLYLPQDPSGDAPNVQAQAGDAGSMLEHVRSLLALRRRYPQLGTYGTFDVLLGEKDRPFVYKRDDLVCFVNPDGQDAFVSYEELGIRGKYESSAFILSSVPKRRGTDGHTPSACTKYEKCVFLTGTAQALSDGVRIGAQSFAVF